MQPRALPDAHDLAERRARRAERRPQQPEPAPWLPEGTGLPDDATLEAAGRVVALPCARGLVPVKMNPTPQEPRPCVPAGSVDTWTPLGQAALWRHVRLPGGVGRWAGGDCERVRKAADAKNRNRAVDKTTTDG